MEKEYKNKKTVNGYLKDVDDFLLFLQNKDIGISEVRESSIKEYNLFLKEEGYSNHTVARKNSSLRLYFKFMRKLGLMTNNPMEDIKQPKLVERKSQLSLDDFYKLFEIAKCKRDILILSLCYFDKVKVSDLVKIKVGQYNKEQGILYLGKRAVLVHQETKKNIDSYINELEKEEFELLLVNQHGKELSVSGVYFLLKKYFEEIGKSDLRPIDLYKNQE